MIRKTTIKVTKIQKFIKEVQNRHKSYVDERRGDFEFSVRDFVFIKVSPMRNIVRLRRAGKLTQRSFPILERIGTLAYRVK